MNNKLRVFEAFSGYGSQSIALKNIGVDYEVVAISEIDKYAIMAYEAIHGKVNNLGDVSKIRVEDIPEHDLFTYSFPCQDISTVGKQASLEEGSGTRSSLLWECKKIIEHHKPKYLLMENVKNLISKKHKPYFDKWIEFLESLGYSSYWKVLNAKDYGIPQNRERIFVVSILGENEVYKFPENIKLEKRLKDLLENNVDEKYNLKNVKDFFIKNSFDMEFKGNGFRFKPHIKKNANISFALTTRCGSRMDDNYIIDVNIEQEYFEYSIKSLKKMISNGEDIKIIDTIKNKNTEKTNCRHWTHDINEIIGYLSETDCKQLKQILDILEGNCDIRKLTPRECFRLMGLSDSDIDKIQNAKISNTQQYKLAGNSIVVNVLEEIFKKLFK